jgi:serine/threonine protein kinase
LERKSSLCATKTLCDLTIDGRPRLQLPESGLRACDSSPTFSTSFRDIFTFSEQFENLGRIGAGSFSEVFKARQKKDGNIYAIKKSKRQFRSKRDRDRHLQEVKTYDELLSETKHVATCPHIVKYFRAWQEDGYLYTQTELCERGNLKSLLEALVNELAEVSLSVSHACTSNLLVSPRLHF